MDAAGTMLRISRETGTSLVELERMDGDRLLSWASALAEQMEVDAEASESQSAP